MFGNFSPNWSDHFSSLSFQQWREGSREKRHGISRKHHVWPTEVKTYLSNSDRSPKPSYFRKLPKFSASSFTSEAVYHLLIFSFVLLLISSCCRENIESEKYEGCCGVIFNQQKCCFECNNQRCVCVLVVMWWFRQKFEISFFEFFSLCQFNYWRVNVSFHFVHPSFRHWEDSFS